MEHIDNYDNHFVHTWNILIIMIIILFIYGTYWYFLITIFFQLFFFRIFINANSVFNHWKMFYNIHVQSLQTKFTYNSSLWNMFKVNRMTPVTPNGVSIVDFKQVNVDLVQCLVSYMFEDNSMSWSNRFKLAELFTSPL